MRRYLSALAVALVALSGAARVYSVQQSTIPIVISYDLDAEGTFVYPVTLGPTSVPSTFIRPQAVETWYEPVAQASGATVDRRIKTTALDPTVVSCVTNSSALEPVAVGYVIQTTDTFGRPVYAGIDAKSSAETVELDRSVDLQQTGCARYRYKKLSAGTAIYDGWFSVAGWGYTTVFVEMTQHEGTGGVDFQIECMPAHGLGTAQVLASSNIASDGSFAVAIPEPWDVCRVGMRHGSADDGDDVVREKISVWAIRRE